MELLVAKAVFDQCEAAPRNGAGTRSPSGHRLVTPQAGRALEMLGHAIEYLADEFTLDCMNGRRSFVGPVPPQIEAIEMLKARNREVYFSCPEAPTLGERLRSWLHLARA
jgi:hypothetical protein